MEETKVGSEQGKGTQYTSGYRPLCMIDTVDKLLERDGLSDRQIGSEKDAPLWMQ